MTGPGPGPVPAADRRPVGPGATLALAHRVLVREIVTRGRIAAMVVLGLVVVVFAAVVGRADSAEPLEDAVTAVAGVGLGVVVPVVALVFAAGVLGDPRDDGTLVYLWLRPLPRWPVVVGAATAVLTVVVPLTVVPVGAAAAVLGQGAELVVAAVLAALVGVVAYTALFLLLGLVVRNAIVWGLAYILVWEGIAAAFGTGPARLAVRGYTRSILTDRTGVELELADLAQIWGVVVPLVVAIVALALAAVRLDRMEVP